MRASDFLNIAARSAKGKEAMLRALIVAAGAFCLCFAGAAHTRVQRERAMPFELTVSAEKDTGMTVPLMAEILNAADVEDMTPLLQIPVQARMGRYDAALTLTGIKPSYLDHSGLPEASVMPYILMNEAACRLFSNKDLSAAKAPEADWMGAGIVLTMGGEGGEVIAKVCGIAESEKDEEAAAYISLSAAKELLRSSGQPGDISPGQSPHTERGMRGGPKRNMDGLRARERKRR